MAQRSEHPAPGAIRVVLMRGGTSKGVFVREADLPPAGPARDAVVLELMGSPDPRQLDGLGGTHSSTSKLMAVSHSEDPEVDAEYLFAQVGVAEPVVDWAGNCGNLTAAVGAYAVDEGLAAPTEPVTDVRLLNRNTGARVIAHVPTAGGRARSDGEERLDGLPTPGAPLLTEWLQPAGNVTGALLATRYAVSRTPVREALRRLEHDGLLERGPRSLQVRRSTPQEIYDLNDVRTVLETSAARRAAERHTELDLVLLYDLLDRMEREDLDVPTRVRLNRRFHAAVWHAGHNATLCQTLERLYLTQIPALHTTLASTPRWRQAVAEHRAVVDAIASGDAETAARVLEEHLRIGRDLRLAQLARASHGDREPDTIREAS